VTALDPATRRALLDAAHAEGIDALAARCGVSPSTLRRLARGGRTRRAEQIAREVWR
jgi:AcrR family transcriptional regulator